MKIKDITQFLETTAPLGLQESYDNAGLIVGDAQAECTGILTSLDVTEAVIQEAINKKCNLIVAHHPIIFKGLKKLNGKNYVERTVMMAIKNDVAIYAIHTNLDNVLEGVNQKIAEKLQLQNCKVLSPREGTLEKLVTFAPVDKAATVRNALFTAGAGTIGNYDQCSYNVEGTGTFRALEGSNPYVGQKGTQHEEEEVRIEVIFPSRLQSTVIEALKKAHPYEEVAFYVQSLKNTLETVGSGLVGELPSALSENELLQLLKSAFHVKVIRHTEFLNKPVKKIAVCGGSGFFLLPAAIASGAQVYITGDVKYHEFFDADKRILLADIGHYESEQFTIELLTKLLQEKFSNFAVQKTEINTNPVRYFS
jgi:dinuclear metal center YbgI/SA1388 family protein